uniref:Uncharacterized protein n=1 Tax=Corvus moneduloides TaxID=1196302 RepID=A0A8U7N8D8_CORMO
MRAVSPIAKHTRCKAGKGGEEELVLEAPLRQAVGNQGVIYVKAPFSLGELQQWKNSIGKYRDNPERVAMRVEMAIKSQNSDWGDLNVMLDELLDKTEREMVNKAAISAIETQIATGSLQESVNDIYPLANPGWDPNVPEQMEKLKPYQKWVFVELTTYSVLNTLNGKLSQDTVDVIGATGVSETRPFFQPLKFKLGKHWVTHQFLYMPNSPMPLLGRDLLEKLEAEIKFSKEEGVKVIIPESKIIEAAAILVQECHGKIPKEVEEAVIQIVWANDSPGRSKKAEPVSITLKAGAIPVRQRQYPLKLEARKGLVPVTEKFLKFGLLVECESRYNTTNLASKES